MGRHLQRPPGNLNPDHTYVINPVTPYGERQVPAERAIAALAEDEFSPRPCNVRRGVEELYGVFKEHSLEVDATT